MPILVIDVNRKKAACIYTRTLGDEERLEEQAIVLEHFARTKSMEVVETICDLNSGSQIDRLEIEKLYEGVENGEYEIILVVHSLRIANNPKDVTAFCERVAMLGGVVYSLTEGNLTRR